MCRLANRTSWLVQLVRSLSSSHKVPDSILGFTDIQIFVGPSCLPKLTLTAFHPSVIGKWEPASQALSYLILGLRSFWPQDFCQKYGTKAIPSTQDLFVFFIWLSPQNNLITFSEYKSFRPMFVSSQVVLSHIPGHFAPLPRSFCTLSKLFCPIPNSFHPKCINGHLLLTKLF